MKVAISRYDSTQRQQGHIARAGYCTRTWRERKGNASFRSVDMVRRIGGKPRHVCSQEYVNDIATNVTCTLHPLFTSRKSWHCSTG